MLFNIIIKVNKKNFKNLKKTIDSPLNCRFIIVLEGGINERFFKNW